MVSPPSFIGNDLSELGVIVDRSVFDDDEDGFTIPMDLPTAIDEEKCFSDSGVETGARGGRVMRNGKVRRRLRWKPPGFRRNKKKNNVSSNQSVVSALTAKSTATNRSTSTTRSIFSHFSRKSQNSHHTFHSTATPVVKNSRQAQHTFQRPNYHDTFEYGMSGPSTIANEGRHVHKKMSQAPRNMRTIGEAQELVPASPADRDIGVSPMTQSSIEFFDPYGEADVPITASGLGATMPLSGMVQNSPPRGAKPPKARRPPLFKRKLMFGKGRPPTTPSDSRLGKNDTFPTVTSNASPLSESKSLERQESLLPGLESDDYEDDRRVSLREQLTQRTPSGRLLVNQLEIEESDKMYGSIMSGNFSMNKSMEAGSVNTASSMESPGSIPSSRFASPVKSANSGGSRRYNRPVDKTVSFNNERSTEEANNKSTSKSRRASVPVDVDEGAFLEAERNLRAIHDMAAEHLAHGEYEEATEVCEEILRGQEARYGRKSYRVGTALHNLGLVHMKSGNYEMAIEVCERAVSVRREALAPNHPDVAVSLAQLGVVHLENESFVEALVEFREALHIRRNHLGPRHLKCAKILNNIGCAEYSLKNYDGALKAFNEALDIQRDALRSMPDTAQDEALSGSNSLLLSVASTLCNVGSILSKQGQFEDAELALEEALLLQQSVLPDEHPAILATIDSIGFVNNLRGGTMESWSRPSRNNRVGTIMCVQPTFEDVLNLDPMSALSPQTWFEHIGDAIAVRAGCGALLEDPEFQKGKNERGRPSEATRAAKA